MQRLTILLAALILLAIGYFVGFYLRIGMPWSHDVTIFFLITVAGAFGGLLYTARDYGFELPHVETEGRKKTLRLGWISDCAYGIGGGYIVFLILPSMGDDPSKELGIGNALELIKLLALALVGGYGGRSLVDRALANIVKDVEDAKRKAERTEAELKQIQITDTKAKALVAQQLDPNGEAQNAKVLKEAVQAASLAARFDIFRDARAARESFSDRGTAEDKKLLEPTIPIFEGLIENKDGDEFHNTHAQLACALMTQTNPDWRRAYEELSTAIAVRNELEVEGFRTYEYDRANCAINLDEDVDLVRQDIEAAQVDAQLLERLQDTNNPVTKWAKKHDVVIG